VAALVGYFELTLPECRPRGFTIERIQVTPGGHRGSSPVASGLAALATAALRFFQTGQDLDDRPTNSAKHTICHLPECFSYGAAQAATYGIQFVVI
jgi:hypothetical protein